MPQPDVFIHGQRLDLVCLDEDQVMNSNWYRWFNDAELTLMMQKHYYPNTRQQQLAFFREHIQGRSDKLQLGILVRGESEISGVVSLSAIDLLQRHAEIAGIMGERKHQNFVLMLEALQLLIVHGFEQLNLYRIHGGTAMKEVAMMFERVLGFQREGLLRSHMYKNGKFIDLFVFGLLRPEFEAIRDRFPIF